MRNINIILGLLFLLVSCQDEQQTDSKLFKQTNSDKASENEMLDEIEKLLEENPDDIDLWIEKGFICKENFDFSCALNAGAKAFLLDSTNLDARSLYAWTLINKPKPPLEDIERAKKHYKYILSVDQNPQIMVELANTYSLTGDFESSFKYLNDALRLDDQIRDAYVMKGSNYRVLENFDLALSSYQTAVQIDPDYFMGHLQIGYLLTELGDDRLALEYYRTAADLDPESIEARYGVAKSLQDLGEYDDAQMEYRGILTRDSTFYFSYFNQGFIKQYLQEEPDSAVHYYNLSLELQPEHVKSWHNLGETYLSQGRKADAARAFSEALRLNPDFEPTIKAKEKLRE